MNVLFPLALFLSPLTVPASGPEHNPVRPLPKQRSEKLTTFKPVRAQVYGRSHNPSEPLSTNTTR